MLLSRTGENQDDSNTVIYQLLTFIEHFINTNIKIIYGLLQLTFKKYMWSTCAGEYRCPRQRLESFWSWSYREYLTWVLRLELVSSVRAASSLNCWNISLAFSLAWRWYYCSHVTDKTEAIWFWNSEASTPSVIYKHSGHLFDLGKCSI